MKKALKQFARYYLVVLVYLVLVFLLFRFAAISKAENNQLSLRYTDAPLTTGQVNNARAYTLSGENEVPFELTFWYQLQSTPISNDFGSTSTGVVYVDGDMAGVYPVNFLYGGYPTSVDTNGIAVSEGLGWKLFGGGDLLGNELEWQGETYYVRGVFEGYDPMLLVQVDAAAMAQKERAGQQGAALTDLPGYAGGVFTGVEMHGEVTFGDPRTQATEFAQKLGLGAPTAVVSGAAISGMMAFMALLPLLILIVWFLYKAVRQLHRLSFWPRQLVVLALLLGLAFLLPWAMGMLPGWMVPNKWSDLDSWSDFFTTMRARINELLSLYPAMRDVEMKKQLLRQLALMVPALFAVTTAIRVWNRRINEYLAGLKPPAAKTEIVELTVEQTEVELLAALPLADDEGEEDTRLR